MNVQTTNLDGAAERLAAYLNIPADALHEYVADDPHPKMGWDHNQGEAPIGSLWSVEGKILYALVRFFAPRAVLELGTAAGASGTHLAAALVATGKGKLTTVDARVHGNQGFETGYLIPPGYREAVKLIQAEGLGFIQSLKPGAFPFIFEDMMHSPVEVEAVWTEAQRILPPGGIVVSHDAGHFLIGQDVRDGIAAALSKAGLPEPLVMVISPGDTGLAVWQKPGAVEAVQAGTEQEEQEPAWQTTETPSSAPSAAKSASSPRRKSGSSSKRG